MTNQQDMVNMLFPIGQLEYAGMNNACVKTVRKTKSMTVALDTKNEVCLGGWSLLGLGVIEASNERILLPDIKWKIKFTSSLGHLIVHNNYFSWA